jgi:hypothetical protein
MTALIIISLWFGCLKAAAFGCKQLKSHTILRSSLFKTIEFILALRVKEIHPVLAAESGSSEMKR